MALPVLPSTQLADTAAAIATETNPYDRVMMIAEQVKVQMEYESKTSELIQENLMTATELSHEVNKGIKALGLNIPLFQPSTMNQWLIDRGFQTRMVHSPNGAKSYPVTAHTITHRLGKNNRISGKAVTASWDASMIEHVLNILQGNSNAYS